MFGNSLLSAAIYVCGLVLNTLFQWGIAVLSYFCSFVYLKSVRPSLLSTQKVNVSLMDNNDTRISHQNHENENENANEEWWNNAMLYSWPQLSEFMIVKVTKFLNNLFNITSTLSIIKSLRVQSVDLGHQPPELKHIRVKKGVNKQGDSILVSQFDLSWLSDCKIVILLQLNILGRSQVHCVITNISLKGSMTAEMSGFVPAIPPFSKVYCYFNQRPELDLHLKFKNSSLGIIKVGHSVVGKAVASLVRDKLIEQACKELVYPRGVEIDV